MSPVLESKQRTGRLIYLWLAGWRSLSSPISTISEGNSQIEQTHNTSLANIKPLKLVLHGCQALTDYFNGSFGPTLLINFLVQHFRCDISLNGLFFGADNEYAESTFTTFTDLMDDPQNKVALKVYTSFWPSKALFQFANILPIKSWWLSDPSVSFYFFQIWFQWGPLLTSTLVRSFEIP